MSTLKGSYLWVSQGEWWWWFRHQVVSNSVTPWTVAQQAPLSMGFSRQEHWSGLPCPPPGDLPDPGLEPSAPALQRWATREALPEWGASMKAPGPEATGAGFGAAAALSILPCLRTQTPGPVQTLPWRQADFLDRLLSLPQVPIGEGGIGFHLNSMLF